MFRLSPAAIIAVLPITTAAAPIVTPVADIVTRTQLHRVEAHETLEEQIKQKHKEIASLTAKRKKLLESLGIDPNNNELTKLEAAYAAALRSMAAMAAVPESKQDDAHIKEAWRRIDFMIERRTALELEFFRARARNAHKVEREKPEEFDFGIHSKHFIEYHIIIFELIQCRAQLARLKKR